MKKILIMILILVYLIAGFGIESISAVGADVGGGVGIETLVVVPAYNNLNETNVEEEYDENATNEDEEDEKEDDEDNGEDLENYEEEGESERFVEKWEIKLFEDVDIKEKVSRNLIEILLGINTLFLAILFAGLMYLDYNNRKGKGKRKKQDNQISKIKKSVEGD